VVRAWRSDCKSYWRSSLDALRVSDYNSAITNSAQIVHVARMHIFRLVAIRAAFSVGSLIRGVLW